MSDEDVASSSDDWEWSESPVRDTTSVRWCAGNVDATRELRKCYDGKSTPLAVIKSLLEANADPTWPGKKSEGHSAVFLAIDCEHVDALRVMYSHWQDIDPFIAHGRYRLLEYAVEASLSWISAECLLALGFPYKHLTRLVDKYSISTKRYNQHVHRLWQRFAVREEACKRACLTLLQPAVRYKAGNMPRDVMLIIARKIWSTRRDDEWEDEKSLRDWYSQCIEMIERRSNGDE